jgi:hypothetical protein
MSVGGICTVKDCLGFEKNKKGRQKWTLQHHDAEYISLSSRALEHGEKTLLNVAKLGKTSVVYI